MDLYFVSLNYFDIQENKVQTLRTRKRRIFVIPWWSEQAQNIWMNPEFIILLISIMNSGFIPTFQARSDCRETMKICQIRVLIKHHCINDAKNALSTHCSKLLHSNLDIVNKSVRPFWFTILNNSLYQMWYA